MDQSGNTSDAGATEPVAASDLDPQPHAQPDPQVEAQVRALLAAIPEPGPMPAELAARISAEISDEAVLRVDRGPLSEADRDSAVLAPLIRQRQRPRPLFALAAVAAAAAVVAVGGSALHLGTRPEAAAVLGDAATIVTSRSLAPTATTPPGAITRPANANLHIQVSRTSYTEDDLARKARDLLTRPDAPLQVLEAEAPRLGPLATEDGLTACLVALGLPTGVPVHIDLASYEGAPAAVIVVSQTGTSTVRVVARTCTTGHPTVLIGPTPVG